VAHFLLLIRVRGNTRNCHSEPRSLFERGEESVVLLVFCGKQLPRSARADNARAFLRIVCSKIRSARHSLRDFL